MRVLVMDDEESILMLLRLALHKDGHAAVLARTLEEGLAAQLEAACDVILLDLSLVRGDGDRAEAVRELSAVTPLIVMSGRADAEREARRFDAVGALMKPFNLQDLSDIIERQRGALQRAGG